GTRDATASDAHDATATDAHDATASDARDAGATDATKPADADLDLITSYISPSATDSRARATAYTLAAPGVATIYYTTDGTTPAVGGPSTTAAPSPVTLMPLSDSIVHWFASGQNGSESVVHMYPASVDTSWTQSDMGAISENVRLGSEGSPVI